MIMVVGVVMVEMGPQWMKLIIAAKITIDVMTKLGSALPGYFDSRDADGISYCKDENDSPSSCFKTCYTEHICPILGTYRPVMCPNGKAANYAGTKCIDATPGYYYRRSTINNIVDRGAYCKDPDEKPSSCFDKCPDG
jgi:hypothetical protein